MAMAYLPSPSRCMWLPVNRLSLPLFRRRSDVHVDLLIPAKPPASKHKQRAYHKDHEDHENCDDSGARCTAAIVCHVFFPPDDLAASLQARTQAAVVSPPSNVRTS